MKDKKVLFELVLLVVLIAVSVLYFTATGGKCRDNKVFYGGDIITVEGNTPKLIEAVAVKGDMIVFAGSKSEAIKMLCVKAKLIDLKGRTMLAGFVEPATISLKKGVRSIKAGEKADFTIFSENPLKTGKNSLKDIKVIGKVYNGEYCEAKK